MYLYSSKRPEAEVVDPTDGIRDFIRARLALGTPPHIGRQVAEIIYWQVDIHLPSQPLESWYWHSRVCQGCRSSWHKHLYNEIPTKIGPETGCPTLRRWATLWRGHTDWNENWRYEDA